MRWGDCWLAVVPVQEERHGGDYMLKCFCGLAVDVSAQFGVRYNDTQNEQMKAKERSVIIP